MDQPRAGQSDQGASQSVTSSCQTCHGCGNPNADPQVVGFQLPTVQPVLEAWAEGLKKDLFQRQDLMLQMMRMEMLQARPPLRRGGYGLLPSF